MAVTMARGTHFLVVAILGLLLPVQWVQAGEPKEAKPAVEMSELEKALAASLSGAELVGFSMRDDKEQGKVTPDRYTIEEAVKLDATHWRMKAKIPVGQVVLPLPLVLEVQWAGDTPVITLTDFAVGPLGTFTARVVFYRGRYAGTWSHGAKDGGNEIGGQIFGRIVPKGEKKPAAEAKDLNPQKAWMPAQRTVDTSLAGASG